MAADIAALATQPGRLIVVHALQATIMKLTLILLVIGDQPAGAPALQAVLTRQTPLTEFQEPAASLKLDAAPAPALAQAQAQARFPTTIILTLKSERVS